MTENKTKQKIMMKCKINLVLQKKIRPKDKARERESEAEEENRLESQELEQKGVQESTDLPDISEQAFNI